MHSHLGTPSEDEKCTRRVWCFAREADGANAIVSQTSAVQYLLEMEALAGRAFQWVAEEGSLCEENMRGIESNLAEVTLCTMPFAVVQAGSCRPVAVPALRRN